MDKVSLPREVAEAISLLKTQRRLTNLGLVQCFILGSPNYFSVEQTLAVETIEKWTQEDYFYKGDKLLSALVNGYKIEQTPEEKVKEYYNDCGMIQKEVVREVLNLLDMKIDGVNKGI